MITAAGLSSILCIVGVTLWIRSYAQADEFVGDTYGSRIIVRSSRGEVLLHYMGPAARLILPKTWSHTRSAPRALDPERSFDMGWETMPGMPVRIGYLLFPHYVFVLITVALPAICFWVIFAGKRHELVSPQARGFPEGQTSDQSNPESKD
jgi:hypothetical protein